MKTRAACPKCGSTRIIQQIEVMDRADSGNQSLSLRRGTRTMGGILRIPRAFPLEAWACGACGYAELYVQEPAQLLAADEESKRPMAAAGGGVIQTGQQRGDQARPMIAIALVLVMILGVALMGLVAFFLAR